MVGCRYIHASVHDCVVNANDFARHYAFVQTFSNRFGSVCWHIDDGRFNYAF